MGTTCGSATSESICRTSAELHARVAELVNAAQTSDALAAVTLVVDSAGAGTLMRRQLVASGLLGDGIGNLRLVTMAELITDLAGRLGLAAGMTLPRLVSEAVVSSILARDPGQFVAIHEHPSTAVRLADLVSELAWCDLEPHRLARVEGIASSTTVDALAFVAKVREEMRTGYAARPLADLAAEVASVLAVTPTPAADLGAVIVAAQTIPAPARAMLTALPDVHLLVLAADDTPLPHRLLGCPDPGTEAAIAVRLAVAAIHEGTPPDQIALLYGSSNPYSSLLGSELDAAGLTWHGPAAGSLASTALARAVGTLLAMAAARTDEASGVTRPLLLRWINAAPVLDGDELRPTWQWRRLVRDQNLYADSSGWRSALQAFVAAGSRMPPDTEVEDEAVMREFERARRSGESAQSLLTGLDALGSSLDAMLGATTWQELGESLWAAVHRFHLTGRWWQGHASERQARDRIESLLLDELPGLDAVDGTTVLDPSVRVEWLGQLLARDLLARRGRVGTMGVGIHVGSVSSAAMQRFARVIVVGAAEGLLPAQVTEDPLLPDPVRTLLRAVPEDLPTTTDRVRHVRTAYCAVLGSADDVVVTYPRGAVAGHANLARSRFLRGLPKAAGQRIPSRAATMRVSSGGGSALPFPVTPTDLAVLDMLRFGDVSSELSAAREAAVSGARADFDRFHGNLEGTADIDEVWEIDGRDLSASAIESYLHCPYHFFVQRILGVGTNEIVDEIDEAGAADVGTLLHAALETFVSEAGRDSLLPAAGEAWPGGSLERLRTAFDEAVAEAGARGLLGWAPAWARRRRSIVDSFDSFFEVDSRDVRADPAVAPEATELRFGFPGDPRVEVTLADGSVVALRGAIDRVDVSDDGSAVGVVDYKSGKSKKFKDMLGMPRPRGAVMRREKVQDLVYDAAARVLRPSATDIKVSFVFVPDAGMVTAVVASPGSDRPAELLAHLEALAEAGRRGRFEPRPGGRFDYCPVCKAMGRQASRAAAAVGIDVDDDAEGGDSDD